MVVPLLDASGYFSYKTGRPRVLEHGLNNILCFTTYTSFAENLCALTPVSAHRSDLCALTPVSAHRFRVKRPNSRYDVMVVPLLDASGYFSYKTGRPRALEHGLNNILCFTTYTSFAENLCALTPVSAHRSDRGLRAPCIWGSVSVGRYIRGGECQSERQLTAAGGRECESNRFV